MKIDDLFPESAENRKKAKKLIAKLKRLSKENNMTQGDPEQNWLGNQFLGTFNKMRMTR